MFLGYQNMFYLTHSFVSGVPYDGQHNLFKDISCQSFFNNNATPLSSLPATFVAHDQNSEKGKLPGVRVQQLCPPLSVGKQCFNNNGAGPSFEAQAHYAKSRGETRARHQPLPRYWPRITDQELQQISGGYPTFKSQWLLLIYIYICQVVSSIKWYIIVHSLSGSCHLHNLMQFKKINNCLAFRN